MMKEKFWFCQWSCFVRFFWLLLSYFVPISNSLTGLGMVRSTGWSSQYIHFRPVADISRMNLSFNCSGCVGYVEERFNVPILKKSQLAVLMDSLFLSFMMFSIWLVLLSYLSGWGGPPMLLVAVMWLLKGLACCYNITRCFNTSTEDAFVPVESSGSIEFSLPYLLQRHVYATCVVAPGVDNEFFLYAVALAGDVDLQ